MTPVLRRYQVMSYVVGTMLLIFCVMIVVRHGFGVGKEAEMIVAQVHGIIYMVYLVTVAQAVLAMRPSGGRVVLMIVSGIIPLLAFFVEPRIMRAMLASQDVVVLGGAQPERPGDDQ
jgi:integral membrane protein